MRFSNADLRILTRCIHEAEAQTEAELVLVLRGSSGNYRDTDFLFGFALSFAVLLFLLFTPTEFPEASLPLPILAAFALGAWICRRFKLRSFLTTAKRRERQVRLAALHVFHEKKVERRRSHCGVLIYISALEKRVELLLDSGAEKRLAAEDLSAFREKMLAACTQKKPAHEFGSAIRSFGILLRRRLPLTHETPAASPAQSAAAADVSLGEEE